MQNKIQPIKESVFEKAKRDNSQVKKLRDKTGVVKTDYSEIQRIIKKYFGN